LLGQALLRRIDDQWVGGLIVETEAYLAAGDLASHSARGKTRSNASMFARPGTLYVYPIHAKHCLNAVTEQEHVGCAVLIRAIEPIWGISRMQQHRGFDDARRLTRGPAMLCQALAVDRSDDGADLVGDDGSITIARPPIAWAAEVAQSPRIGISKAIDHPLRYFVRGNRFVSGRKGG
jgi:DNA-3-methyladenine glycosylase